MPVLGEPSVWSEREGRTEQRPMTFQGHSCVFNKARLWPCVYRHLFLSNVPLCTRRRAGGRGAEMC